MVLPARITLTAARTAFVLPGASVLTGGRARVHLAEGVKRAELALHPAKGQNCDAVLLSEGEDLKDHLSLSFRQEPLSGTFWRKQNFASCGVLTIDLGEMVEGIDTLAVFQLAGSDAKCTTILLQRAPTSYAASATPPTNKLEWIDVTDAGGNVDLPVCAQDTSLGGPSGSVMHASCVLKVPKFSTRWLRLELLNDSTIGCIDGVGLRQIKAFCSPSWSPVPAHDAHTATWTENPSAPAAGPALNRVGADSIQPAYEPPEVEAAGGAKSMDGVIGLPSDFSLLCYSVPTSGVSEVPASGSALLHSLSTMLLSAHHKHTVQDMLSGVLQELVDYDCSVRCSPAYSEVVRLLQKRCDEEDFPLMLDLGPERELSYGVPGPDACDRDMTHPAKYRHYDLDVPEPRNIERDRAVGERLKARSSIPVKKLEITFHPRLRAGSVHLSHGNLTLTKSARSMRPVAACSLQIPPSIKRLAWDIRVGALEVLGGDALAVPQLRVGVIRQNLAREISFDDYTLGDDDSSWCIQTGSVSLYKVHAGKRERAGGLRFNKGDVVTLQLDLDKQTLAFTVNGSDFVAPFTNVRGPVIPAISTDNKTVCRLTIDKCSHW